MIESPPNASSWQWPLSVAAKVADILAQRTLLQAQKVALVGQLGADHQDVRAIQEKIDELDYDFNRDAVDTGFVLPDDARYFDAQGELDATYRDAERVSPAPS